MIIIAHSNLCVNCIFCLSSVALFKNSVRLFIYHRHWGCGILNAMKLKNITIKHVIHFFAILTACTIPIAAGEQYRQMQERNVDIEEPLLEAQQNYILETPSQATPVSPSEAIEEETKEEAELSPDCLNLAFLFSEGADSSESMAARLYLRLADRDAGWISKLYDFYSDTPLEAARYLQLPDEAVMAEMGSVSEFKSMNVGYYDGEGRPVLRLSNSRIIVAMCSTLYSYGVLDTEEELEAYADYLWDASHDFQISLGEVYYCDGGCELASEAAQAGAEPEALEGYKYRSFRDHSLSGILPPYYIVSCQI